MSLFTCEICGQDGLTEAEMKTHRLVAHIESDVSCMFCDLAGVTVDEMMYHINSAHADQQHDCSICQPATENCCKLEEEDRCSDSKIGCECEVSEKAADIVQKHCSSVLLYSRAGGSKDKTHNDDSVEQERKRICYRLDKTGGSAIDCGYDGNELPLAYWSCPLCDHIAENEALLQVHVAVEHNDSQSSGYMNETETLTCSLLPCPVCAIEFVDELHLQLHVDEHFKHELQIADQPGRNGPHVDQHFLREPQHVQGRAQTYHPSVLGAVRRDQAAQLMERRAREATKLYQERLRESSLSSSTSTPLTVCKSGNDGLPQRISKVPAQDCDNRQGCTSGIIERLSRASGGAVDAKCRARYLSSPTDHFESYGWDCGYRNLQMLLSSLAQCPMYLESLFNGTSVIPSVLKLQKLLEAAWSKGFDRTGSAQLNCKVVGTRKWIGATEIAALLSSLHVKCEIYDFHQPTGPGNTHPRLFEFVSDHCKKSAETFVPPLYLQRQGHSITIVGIEEASGGLYNLLVFDPGCHKMTQLLTAKQNELNDSLSLMRRTVSAITSKQYQILKVVGLLNDAEFEKSKTVSSIRIP